MSPFVRLWLPLITLALLAGGIAYDVAVYHHFTSFDGGLAVLIVLGLLLYAIAPRAMVGAQAPQIPRQARAFLLLCAGALTGLAFWAGYLTSLRR